VAFARITATGASRALIHPRGRCAGRLIGIGQPCSGTVAGVSDPDRLRGRLQQSVGKPVADLELKRRHPAVARVVRPIRRAVNPLLERMLGPGLDTSRRYADLAHFHPDRVTYQPSGWRYLRRGLRKRNVTADDVFVDFGCGKGRVLCQAARYPFGRVIGVEVSEPLIEIARSNVARNRSRFACRDVELVTADVVDFKIPEDLTVAYFYHPFAGKTFETVIDRLVDSVERNPRRLTIIYACPGMERYILATGRFRLARSSRGGWRDFLNRRVSVYVHDPAAFAAPHS
jgi:SAM-dependent methyltransferase